MAGPLFFRRCLTTHGPLAEIPRRMQRRSAVQCDGSFLGGVPSLPSMMTWRIMVGLRQDNHSTLSPDFGARFQLLWMFPLTSGRHTLAIGCLGNWSDEVEFYWDSTTVKR